MRTHNPTDRDAALDEIIREFSPSQDDGRIHDRLPPELVEDEPTRELLGDMPITEEAPRGEEPDVLVWTPRPKQPAAPPVSSETLRLNRDEVRDAAAEPFTGNWEPQYEQPIGEYVPPEPIIFRPRSRLSELRHKLIEGPEQRYNALSEKGVTKLQIALFVSMLTVVLAVASIVLHRLDMVQENRMRLLVFGELFAMLVSATLCWELLAQGIVSIFRGRFQPNTLLAFSFAACIADGIYCLEEVTVPFCAAFSLEALMCLWSEYQKRSTELHQMDTLRRASRLNRISKAPDCHEGHPGFRVSDGQPEDFMDTYQVPSAPQKALNRFTLAALIASVLVALTAGGIGGMRAGVRTWSAAILAACPATLLICQTRPGWILQRRLHRFGAVLCGWKGVQTAAGRAVVPISDEDLMPSGSVKINGIKFYSNRNPDSILAYATAIMTESGSCLARLFEHMVKTRKSQRYELEEFKSYGDQGLGAIICGEKVLLGTQEFLKTMGIHVPDGFPNDPAIYVAIEQEFVCRVVLAFGKLKGVSAGLGALCAQRKLTPVLTSNNFVLEQPFIRSKYRVDTDKILFPSPVERERLAAWAPEQSEHCALTTQEGLAGMAFAITGARSLRTAAIAGAAVHILGGCVGLAAVLILTLLGRVDLMTPANLLLLELIWAVPGLMITEWTRNL